MPDLASLQAMIQATQLLTDAERAYWLAGLARMTPEQLERLKGILDRAAKISWNAAMKGVVSSFSNRTTPIPV